MVGDEAIAWRAVNRNRGGDGAINGIEIMAGYTPLFNTVLDGTLYGRWPHTGIWVCLLSQCDRQGHIDVAPALLAAKIGIPVDLLMSCISDFMKPDPGSRTGDKEGRRLELIDSVPTSPDESRVSRDWGWRVINHKKYRDRARKSAYDKERTESGADAERKREIRELQKVQNVPTSPDESRLVPLSYSYSDTDLRKDIRTRNRSTKKCPPEFLPDAVSALAEIQDLDLERELAKFKDYEFKTPKSDWPATWRNWLRKAKDDGKYSRKQATVRRWD